MEKLKKILWPIAIGLVLAVLAFQFLGPPPIHERDDLASQMESDSGKWFAKERNLSDFTADMRAGKVTALGIGVEYALVTAEKDARYHIRIDTQRPLFLDVVKEKQVKPPVVVALGEVAPPRSAASKILGVFTLGNLMVVTMFVLVGLIATQAGLLGQTHKMFKRVQRPKIRFSDVIGSEEAKSAVEDLVAYLKNPKQFAALGATAPHGVLLAGDPGTGKTRLAQAMAGEAGCGFLALSGSDFTDKYVGVGVGRVRKLMKVARENAPTVVFIDEIDGIGRRGSAGDAVSNENNRIINALLVELDGFTANDGVIVVGATNNLERIDPALIREGRFDRVCHTTLPTIDERQKLFEMYAGRVKQGPGIDMRQLARLAAGLSPAAIATVVNSAALTAGKVGAAAVTHDHFTDALEQHSMGSPTAAGKNAMRPQERERLAAHEGGHALATKILKMGVLEKVSILPRGNAGGVTWVTQDHDVSLCTEQEMLNRMAVLLAGRGAERLLLGGMSTGASDDLRRVTEMAHQMVTRYGFSETLGAINYEGLPAEAQRSSVVSPEVMSEVRALIAQADALMWSVLTEHRAVLEQIVAALLEHETITGQEISELLAERPGQGGALKDLGLLPA